MFLNANQTATCTQDGLACAERINVNYDLCLTPCEGIYADVKKVPETGKHNLINDNLFIERYRKYKKFYEKSSSKYYIL